jgi:hypothetical protein
MPATDYWDSRFVAVRQVLTRRVRLLRPRCRVTRWKDLSEAFHTHDMNRRYKWAEK